MHAEQAVVDMSTMLSLSVLKPQTVRRSESFSDIPKIKAHFAESDSRMKILAEIIKLETELLNQECQQSSITSDLVQRDFDLLFNQYLQVLEIVVRDGGEGEIEEGEENTSSTCYERSADGMEFKISDAGCSGQDDLSTSVGAETPSGNGSFEKGDESENFTSTRRKVLYVPTKRIEWKLREDFLYPFYKRVHPKRPILRSKSRNYHPFGFSEVEIEACRRSWGCEPMPDEYKYRRNRRWWKKSS